MSGAELWTRYHNTFTTWEPDSFALLQIFRGGAGVKWMHQKSTENLGWGKVPIYFISFLDGVQLGDCCCRCCSCCSGLANIQVRALTKCPFLRASISQLESKHWLAHYIISVLRSARETGLFQTVWIGLIRGKDVPMMAVLAHPYLFLYPQKVLLSKNIWFGNLISRQAPSSGSEWCTPDKKIEFSIMLSPRKLMHSFISKYEYRHPWMFKGLRINCREYNADVLCRYTLATCPTLSL